MLELIIVVLLILALFGGVTWGPWPGDNRNPIYLILAVLVLLWLLSYIGVIGGHARYHW